MLLSWLFDTTSLTQRLRQACRGRLEVRVVGQARGRPLRDERMALGMRRPGDALIRMVYLVCDGRPWVFARTVIPLRTLSGAQRRLKRLGSKPLGEVLFADKSMRRDEMEAARLATGQPVFEMAAQRLEPRPREIWGRRSVFYLQGKPLLVSEMFLPDPGSVDICGATAAAQEAESSRCTPSGLLNVPQVRLRRPPVRAP